MKSIIKSILIVVLTLAVIIGGWFLYLIYGPQLSMEDVLPANALVYAELKDPVHYWDSFEKSDLYKNLIGIDMVAVLKHNKVPPVKAEQFLKSFDQAKALIKNPIIGKLLGKEIAFAQYPSLDPKVGAVLITRSLASIQVAANVSLFLKDLGQDIVVRSENVNGQVVVHFTFKQKDLSFKYTHIRNLLVFTDEKSTLINDVIVTVAHQRPSLKSDDRFREIAADFYPKAQGSLYVNIKDLLHETNSDWTGPLTKEAGFKAYAVSFLPGAVSKYKFLLTYDQQKVDPHLKGLFSCIPTDNNAMALVPPSAIAYHWGGCYEFKDIAVGLKASAESALQNQPKRIRKSLQKKLSSSELTDLIALLGREAGMYVTDIDTHGVFPFPRFLFFVKVNDPLKAKGLLEGIIGAKKGFSLIAKDDYNGNEIHYFVLPLGGNMDPGFAFQGDYFLLASSRQLLKRSMDAYKDPSISLLEDKQFKAKGFDIGKKPSAILDLKIKEMSTRALGIVEWYDRYLTNQVELAGTYQKEAVLKKNELTRDITVIKGELSLATTKLKEWKAKLVEGLSPEELANDEATIKNFVTQIDQAQGMIKDDLSQIKEIDRVVAKNAVQVANYRSIMYNTSRVLIPVFKGLGAINTLGIKFATSASTVEAEFMLN